MPDGRFAPSPTGPLHLGNLRTALLAWLFARSSGGRFLVRIEDLDAVAAREEHVRAHLADLEALGLDHDGAIVRQSSPERRARHEAAIGTLVAAGRTYPCYCTRREVLEASSAPHGDLPEGNYRRTCRSLSDADRAAREAAGRRPALRLDAGAARVRIVDRFHGPYEAVVDDLVLRRADGAPAYNLAVVVDDADQGIGEVVRGDDLLPTTPRQALLAGLLGLPLPAHAHVPLVLAPDGRRLAKRDGATTVADQMAAGRTTGEVLSLLASSLGLCEPGERVAARDLVPRFDPDRLSRDPWRVPAEVLAPRR